MVDIYYQDVRNFPRIFMILYVFLLCVSDSTPVHLKFSTTCSLEKIYIKGAKLRFHHPSKLTKSSRSLFDVSFAKRKITKIR
jgi:hypothetical protein